MAFKDMKDMILEEDDCATDPCFHCKKIHTDWRQNVQCMQVELTNISGISPELMEPIESYKRVQSIIDNMEQDMDHLQNSKKNKDSESMWVLKPCKCGAYNNAYFSQCNCKDKE